MSLGDASNPGTTDPSEMVETPDSLGALDAVTRERLGETLDRVRQGGQTRWAALVEEMPAASPLEDALDCYARAGTRDRFLWERGESEESSVAWGVADEIESAGPDRFRDVGAWTESVRTRIDWIGDPRPTDAATFFGGFGFEAESRGSAEWKAFPAARFVLPEIIVERTERRSRRILLARVEPGASLESVEAELLARRAEVRPPDAIGSGHEKRGRSEKGLPSELPASPEDWSAGPEYRVRADRSHDLFRAQVHKAFEAFERGDLSKVVLARSLSIDHDDDIDVPAFLARLRSLYPTCTLIAMGRGRDTFLAATPETLIRVRGSAVETAALAGSAPRGRNPDEDRSLADGLMSSAKERSEHAHVALAIREVLERACEELEVPAKPSLRRLFGIQHLETPIRGRLAADEVDTLALVEALHPTPAVGGVPRAAALEWLHRYEGLDRGWYAAPIGWLDARGGGDFRVALRSGLIRNGLGESGHSGASRALLFAGAGIVEGSDPEQELVETRIKLRALLAPLTEI